MRNIRRALLSRKRYRQANAEGNTSVFRFNIGEMGQVWEHYRADPAHIVNKFRREQEFVCHEARKAGLLQYWPQGLCISYAENCRQPGLLSGLMPRVVPESARVVIFTSGLTMGQLLAGEVHERLRPREDTSWLRAAWRDEA